MPGIKFRGNRTELHALLQKIPFLLAGRVSENRAKELVRRVKIRMANALLKQIKEAFIQKSAGGVGSDGIKWAKLKPSTLARKRRNPGILRETDRLLRSLTPGEGDQLSGEADQIVDISGDAFTVGTAVPYAEWHQKGTPRMAARKLWPAHTPAAWRRALRKAAAEGLKDLIAELTRSEAWRDWAQRRKRR